MGTAARAAGGAGEPQGSLQGEVWPAPASVLHGCGWLDEVRTELWGPPGNVTCTYGFVSGRE